MSEFSDCQLSAAVREPSGRVGGGTRRHVCRIGGTYFLALLFLTGYSAALARENDPVQQARILYRNGVTLCARGEYSAAAEAFFAAKTLLNAVAEDSYRQGVRYYASGDYSAAAAAFSRAKSFVNQSGGSSPAATPPASGTAVGVAAAGTALPPADDGFFRLKDGRRHVYPGDILYIQVLEHDDLQREATVGSDGHISFPLIGIVPAAGRTVSQLQNELTGALAEYIRNPRVSVSIRKSDGARP